MNGYRIPPPTSNPWLANQPPANGARVAYPAYPYHRTNAYEAVPYANVDQIRPPAAVSPAPTPIPRPSSQGIKRFWTTNNPNAYEKNQEPVEPSARHRSYALPQRAPPANQYAPTVYVHERKTDSTQPYAHRSSRREREGAPLNPPPVQSDRDRKAPNGKGGTDAQEQRKAGLWKFHVMGLQRGGGSKQKDNADPLPASRGRTDARRAYDIKKEQDPPRGSSGEKENEMNRLHRKDPQISGRSIKDKFSGWLTLQARESSSDGGRLSKLFGRRRNSIDPTAARREVPNMPPRMSLQQPRPTGEEQKRTSRIDPREFEKRAGDVEGRKRTYSGGRPVEPARASEVVRQEPSRHRQESDADRYARDGRTQARDPRRESYQREARRDYRNEPRPPEGRRLSRSRSRSRENADRAKMEDVHRVPSRTNRGETIPAPAPSRERRTSLSRTPFPGEIPNSSLLLSVPGAHPPVKRSSSVASRNSMIQSQPIPAGDPNHRSRRSSVSSNHSHTLPVAENENTHVRSRAGSRASATDVPPLPLPRSRAGSRASASDAPIIAPIPRQAVEPQMNLTQATTSSSNRRKPSPSRSRSRDIDPLTRQNTLHNATNLTYDPTRDDRPRKISANRHSHMDFSYYSGGAGDPHLQPAEYPVRGYNSDNPRGPPLHPRRYTTAAVPLVRPDPNGYIQPPIGQHPSLTGMRPPNYAYPQEAGRYYNR